MRDKRDVQIRWGMRALRNVCEGAGSDAVGASRI
jgi:hypothetical protein